MSVSLTLGPNLHLLQVCDEKQAGRLVGASNYPSQVDAAVDDNALDRRSDGRVTEFDFRALPCRPCSGRALPRPEQPISSAVFCFKMAKLVVGG